MAKEVNIHLKTQGAQQVKRDTDQAEQGLRGLGDEAQQTGGKLGAVAEDLKGYINGMVGLAAVVGGITKAITANKEAIEEHARVARQQQESLFKLQFIGDYFKEQPQMRSLIYDFSEYGRRPVESVAEAWYNLRSKGGAFTEQQQLGVLKEALEMGRLEPEASLQSIIDMMLLYGKQTGATDPNAIQNVLRQTITEAGASLGQTAQYLPEFLPIGMSGGLTGPQSAGLWSFITGQFASPAVATTGLRSVFMSLMGRGTPESQKILEGLGVRQGMTFFEKLRALRAANLTLPQAELIAAREGAAPLLSMVRGYDDMMRIVGSVSGADRGDIDLTQASIEELLASDEVARLVDEGKLLDMQIKNIKARDKESLRKENFYDRARRDMMRDKVPPVLITLMDWLNRTAGAMGWSAAEMEDPDSILNFELPGWGNPPGTVVNYNTNFVKPEEGPKARYPQEED